MPELPGLAAPSARPRRFHGWAMLAVATVCLVATAPGQTVLVSQFNASFRADLGLSASALSVCYMVGTVTAALPLVLVGRLADRRGPRLVTAMVVVLFAAACGLIGLMREAIGLTLAFFLLRFLGQGALGLLSGHMLALWWERRLGTVNGIKMTVAQLGFGLLPALVIVLIDAFGWRTAYALLGAGAALVVLPLLAFVARDHPHQVGQEIDGDDAPDPSAEGGDARPARDDPAFTLRAALRTPAYWIIALSLAMNGLIGTALLFHAQPLLELRGLAPEGSAAIVRTWSIALMVCTVPCGWLSDRVAPHRLVPLSVVLLGTATAIQLLPGGIVIMHASMATFGVSGALAVGAGTPAIARFFGRAHHGAIRSTVTKLGVAGTGLGPIALGLSLDHAGGPDAGLVCFVLACVPLAVAGLCLRRPVRPGVAPTA